jgi:acetylornithine deacetylase/succinyl-diaminopimelate desuccinylase-like protein
MIESVDATRLRDLTLELVEVESPTGDTAAAAHLYATLLRDAGLEVDVLDDPFPATPIVVGRLAGGRPGPRIVLNGHLDTVPIPHAPPCVEGDVVHGRGAADMKGACVCALEAARIAAEHRPFPGELAVVAIGLHEAPGGRGEDLTWLLSSGGFTADLAVVCELGGHSLPVAHMGQATVEITISRPGMASHELQTPPGTPNPNLVAARVVEAMRRWTEDQASTEHAWVGAETMFVGEVHGGDFYNRHPAACRVVGTRRWAPGNTLPAVREELEALLQPIAEAEGVTIDLDLRLVRDAYEIALDHPLATALQGAYADVTGMPLDPVGLKVVADGAVFQAVGGIPSVYHGPVGSGAHADEESIAVAELVRATSVYLRLLERLWAGA